MLPSCILKTALPACYLPLSSLQSIRALAAYGLTLLLLLASRLVVQPAAAAAAAASSAAALTLQFALQLALLPVVLLGGSKQAPASRC